MPNVSALMLGMDGFRVEGSFLHVSAEIVLSGPDAQVEISYLGMI